MRAHASIFSANKYFQIKVLNPYRVFVDRYERDSVVVGIVRNVYNWLYHGIVGNSVCRTWESCTLAFPCAVNRVIHDSIACYAHFHNACLLVFVFFGSE